MSAADRRRGHDCERTVARWLQGHGFPDAITTRAKLGHDGATAPGDIDFAPGICLEVKDVARSARPSWRAQAVAEAGGRVPIVLRRTRGVTDVGRWVAQIPVGQLDRIGMHPSGLATHCPRTEMAWTSMPFELIVAALRESAAPQGASA